VKFAEDNKLDFMETSAKTGTNIHSSFIKIVKYIDKDIKNNNINIDNKNTGIDIEDDNIHTYGCYC
jgi:hypoxanthine-guanine phosphoribosyltransferase